MASVENGTAPDSIIATACVTSGIARIATVSADSDLYALIPSKPSTMDLETSMTHRVGLANPFLNGQGEDVCRCSAVFTGISFD